jgi:hypothetical protein
VLLTLLTTGLLIWGRRRFRQRSQRGRDPVGNEASASGAVS